MEERERLRQLAIEGLHRLSMACTLRGEYAADIEYTNRLLALEPWQEEAYQQLMTLLARSGQHNAALCHLSGRYPVGKAAPVNQSTIRAIAA